MERYDYLEAVKNDVLEYIHNEVEFIDYDSIEDLEVDLNDELWSCDSVTGNASGSYTFNAWTAEEYIAHNLDLLGEALEEFGSDPGELVERGAEWADVTIRCYLLGQSISEALEEIEDEFNEAHEGEGDEEQ